MLRSILLLCVLAIPLTAPNASAQGAPPGASAPAVGAVDPAVIQALKDMGAFLQTLKRFGVSTELTGERVLADGQKLQHTATADMDVQRPNKVRVLMHSARSERVLVYDGKVVTLQAPALKYYSTVEFSGTIGELIDQLEQKYGVQLPLSDLFLWGTPAAPLDKIVSAMNAGQDVVGHQHGERAGQLRSVGAHGLVKRFVLRRELLELHRLDLGQISLPISAACCHPAAARRSTSGKFRPSRNSRWC